MKGAALLARVFRTLRRRARLARIEARAVAFCRRHNITREKYDSLSLTEMLQLTYSASTVTRLLCENSPFLGLLPKRSSFARPT